MDVAPMPNWMAVHLPTKVAMPMPDGKTTHDQNGEDDENDEECAKTELKEAFLIF